MIALAVGVALGLWAVAAGLVLGVDGLTLGGFGAVLCFYGLLELAAQHRIRLARAARADRQAERDWQWPPRPSTQRREAA